MVASVCRFQNRNWNGLVEDLLPPSESNELTKHLEACSACRKQFDSKCADAATWTESGRMLQQIRSDSIELAKFSSDINSPSYAAIDHGPSTKSERTSAISSAILSWLKPPIDSESLGELDEYSIRELIGYGGMGTVMRAWDRKLCRMVAIKILHPHLASSGPARRRFAREAQAVAGIVHPNVVPIHDVAAEHQPPYIVMGFVAGGSLQEKIDRDGFLALEEALRIAMQIAEGLVAAHGQGLVHRDIKPANILLESRWQRVLITDFGLARALDDASLTASGMLAGTPQFMSPEQAMGEDIDHRSDLFSLGSVLYTMLTGHPPFRAETAAAVLRRVSEGSIRPVHASQEQLPTWVQPLLNRFLARDRNQRIHDATEAAQLLKSCLQHVQNPTAFAVPNELATPVAARPLWFTGGLVGCLLAGFLASQIPQVRNLFLAEDAVIAGSENAESNDRGTKVDSNQADPTQFDGAHLQALISGRDGSNQSPDHFELANEPSATESIPSSSTDVTVLLRKDLDSRRPNESTSQSSSIRNQSERTDVIDAQLDSLEIELLLLNLEMSQKP